MKEITRTMTAKITIITKVDDEDYAELDRLTVNDFAGAIKSELRADNVIIEDLREFVMDDVSDND